MARFRFRSAVTGLFVTARSALTRKTTTVREAVKDPRVMIAHHGKPPFRKVHSRAISGLSVRLIEAADDLCTGMLRDEGDGQLHYDCDHVVSQTMPNGDLLIVQATLHRPHEAPGS